MLFAVALFSLCMGIAIPENYALNLAGAIALGVALFPMQWSACDKVQQKFYHRLYRTLDCLTIGFPTLGFVSTFVASIIVAGSAEVTHGETTNSAAVFFERADAVKAGLSFGWGEHAMSRTIETQTMFIRHTATELQRRIATQNAKTYYAHLAPRKKNELKKKNIRYWAVPTVRSEQTSPKAVEILMIWDIPRESLVGQNVYELEKKPQIGTLASYDDLKAEYVGTLSGRL